MQQRSLSSFRATDDHSIINVPTQEPQAGRNSPARRSMDHSDGLLPVFDPRSGIRRREISRYKLVERWIHSIPLVLLLILFVLWWFSYPVNLAIKDGGITTVDANAFPQAPKYIDHVELAILGDAIMQIASSPLNLTSVGVPDFRIPSKVAIKK